MNFMLNSDLEIIEELVTFEIGCEQKPQHHNLLRTSERTGRRKLTPTVECSLSVEYKLSNCVTSLLVCKNLGQSVIGVLSELGADNWCAHCRRQLPECLKVTPV